MSKTRAKKEHPTAGAQIRRPPFVRSRECNPCRRAKVFTCTLKGHTWEAMHTSMHKLMISYSQARLGHGGRNDHHHAVSDGRVPQNIHARCGIAFPNRRAVIAQFVNLLSPLKNNCVSCSICPTSTSTTHPMLPANSTHKCRIVERSMACPGFRRETPNGHHCKC